MQKYWARFHLLLKHAQFAFAEATAETEAQIFEEFDFDSGMHGSELFKALSVQHVASDFRVGHNCGRAGRMIQHGDFTEDHAGRKRCQPFVCS
jgi:hypothetical protein